MKPGAPDEESGQKGLRSLGTRIALWYGGLVALCLLAYSIAVVVFFTRHVETELDRRVHEDVELAERAVTVSDSGLPVWRGGSPPWSGVHEEEGGGHWLELWSLDGRRLLSDGTLDAVELGPAPEASHPLDRPHTHVPPPTRRPGPRPCREGDGRRKALPSAGRGLRGLVPSSGAADVDRGAAPVPAGAGRRWAERAMAGAQGPGSALPACRPLAADHRRAAPRAAARRGREPRSATRR